MNRAIANVVAAKMVKARGNAEAKAQSKAMSKSKRVRFAKRKKPAAGGY